MARESRADKQARVRVITRQLQRSYPEAKCALHYTTPHELLVATILSAQCTDERVNKTTPALFARYRSVEAYAQAEPAKLEGLIKSTGFFRSKAKSIRNSAREITERFGGVVPSTLDELTSLAGVGRKTASVVLGVWFNKAEGIVVDTHVGRISRLLRLTSADDPLKIERDLMALIPKQDWIDWSHLLIHHGRAVCIARRPRCAVCPIEPHCPSSKLSKRTITRKA